MPWAECAGDACAGLHIRFLAPHDLIRIVIYIVHVKELELQCIATFCIPPHTVTQAMDSTVHSLTSM